MDSIKKYAIFMFFIFLLSYVNASENQPALPTYIYGKIINSDNSPAQGVRIRAIWVDNSGIERTTLTTTYTERSAPSQDKAGYYYFNQGYVQAAPDSWIIITAEDIEIKRIISKPGESSVRIKDKVMTSNITISLFKII